MTGGAVHCLGNLGFKDSLLSLIDSGFEGATAASEIGGGTDVVNPSHLLRVLDGNDASTTRVGPQTVDGVATTHYKAVVPLGDLGQCGRNSRSDGPARYLVVAGRLFGRLFWPSRPASMLLRSSVSRSASAPSTVASSTTSITVPTTLSRLAKGRPASIRWVAARSNSLSPSRSRSIFRLRRLH